MSTKTEEARKQKVEKVSKEIARSILKIRWSRKAMFDCNASCDVCALHINNYKDTAGSLCVLNAVAQMDHRINKDGKVTQGGE